MAIGWFGEDWWSYVSDAADAVEDVATSVIDRVPGGEELRGALRDFAKTPAGSALFAALSSTLYGPLAWTVGPQIASVVWTIPGLLAGEDFWSAWISEVQYRAEKTAEIFGGQVAAELVPYIGQAKDALVAMFPAGLPPEIERLGYEAVDELAARIKVDEWTAALAASALGWIPIPDRNDFDPVTGKRWGVLTTIPLSEGLEGSLFERYGTPWIPRETGFSGEGMHVATLEDGGAVAVASGGAPTMDERLTPSRAPDWLLPVSTLAAGGLLFWWYRGAHG